MIAIDLVGKVTLVLVVALGLDFVLRRRAVLACAAMWNEVLVSLVALPAAVLLLPALPLAVLSLEVGPVSTPLARPAPDRIHEWAPAPSGAT